MGRTKFEIQDSFDNIFRDLARVGSDAAIEMRKELGIAVGEIINETPQDTGMAASGWTKAAAALGAKHQPIKDGERRSKVSYIGKERLGGKVVRSADWGRRMSKYQETVPFAALKRAVKTGDLPKKLEFEAVNAVKHATFLEYGVAFAGRGIQGVQGHFAEEVQGFAYARKPLHIVRNAMRRMKQRIGPAFAKALRANIKRPKRYKRTVVQ